MLRMLNQRTSRRDQRQCHFFGWTVLVSVKEAEITVMDFQFVPSPEKNFRLLEEGIDTVITPEPGSGHRSTSSGTAAVTMSGTM